MYILFHSWVIAESGLGLLLKLLLQLLFLWLPTLVCYLSGILDLFFILQYFP